MTAVNGSSSDDGLSEVNSHNVNGMPPAEPRMSSLGTTSSNPQYQNQETTNGDRLQPSES
jgi:hypothetical protein